MMQVGYKRKDTVKVIRSHHTVVIREGLEAKMFKDFFSKVPDDAVLVEIWEGDEGFYQLRFCQEQEATHHAGVSE